MHIEVLERSACNDYGQLIAHTPSAFAQQSVQWADVIAPISPDTPYFIIARRQADGSVVGGLALYHFIGRLGSVLTSVPHAGPLGGIVSTVDLSVANCQKMFSSLVTRARQLAEELDCVSMSIITNPFINDGDLYQSESRCNYVLNNFCQVLDLQAVIDDSGNYNTGVSRYNSLIKRNLELARNSLVEISWGAGDEFDEWYEIHCMRHRELGATPLPRRLLSGVVTHMKQANMGGLAVAKSGGKIVGGSCFLWHKDVADSYMPSTASEYLPCGVNYALTDFAVRYFLKKGVRWLNFQSCQRGSGVYQFKKRWGSVEKPYKILTWTFSGIDKILGQNPKTLSSCYPWHYVVPFPALINQSLSGNYEK